MSTSSANDAASRALVETLEGRLPVQPTQRLYTRTAPYLWTSASLACASYAYLVGTSLPSIGNTWLGILGFWIGTVISMVLVIFAVGIPSFRYGLDTIDVAKAALGVRGSKIFMVTIVLSCVGWGNVLLAMTARAAGVLASTAQSSTGTRIVDERLVVLVALAVVAAMWWLTCRGPELLNRITSWCVPGQLIVALVLLVLLVAKYGTHALLHTNVSKSVAIATEPHMQLALAIEFGMSTGLTMVPFLGGLTRLVQRPGLLVSPSVSGYAFGATFISGVAALAAACSGSPDPLLWLTVVAGPTLGSIMMLFLVTANIAALVTFMYLGSIAIQQVGPLARSPWRLTVTLVLLPSLIVAFNTQAMLDLVMTLLTYNGVMFVGLAGVLLGDYYLIRRQVIVPAHLFTTSRAGYYWYWGGVNWVAMAIVVAASTAYLGLYNPVTLAVRPEFHYLGAAIPVMFASAVVYVAVMRMTHAARGESGLGANRPVVEVTI